MNCHRARMALVELDLGELPLGHERALEGHLEACADCRAQAAREALLVGELREMREADLPLVDVRAQVLNKVKSLAPVDTLPVPHRQLVWSSLGAVAAAVVVAAGLLQHAGWLQDAASKGVTGARALLSASLSVVAALKSLLLLPWRILAGLQQAAAPMFDNLGRLEPYAIATISMGLLSMMLTIAWIVGKDLRRPWRKQE